MNDMLCAIDCEVTYTGGVKAGRWTVRDNHGVDHAYHDGVAVPPADPRDAQRGRIAMAAVQRELQLGGINWNGRGGHNAPGVLPPPTRAAPAPAPAAAANGPRLNSLAAAVGAAPWQPQQASQQQQAAAATAPAAPASQQQQQRPQRPPPPGIRATQAAAAPAPAPAHQPRGAWGSGAPAAERLSQQQQQQQQASQQRRQQQQQPRPSSAAAPQQPRKTVVEQLNEQEQQLNAAAGGHVDHLEEHL
jgi:hypothetical protein